MPSRSQNCVHVVSTWSKIVFFWCTLVQKSAFFWCRFNPIYCVPLVPVSIQNCVLSVSSRSKAAFWCLRGPNLRSFGVVLAKHRSCCVISVHNCVLSMSSRSIWRRLGPPLRSFGIVSVQNCVLAVSSRPKTAFFWRHLSPNLRFFWCLGMVTTMPMRFARLKMLMPR